MDFRSHLEDKLKDPKFRNNYELEKKILELSIKLQKEREKQQLTQKALAEKAGVTQQQLSKIEKGYNSNIFTYFKIANALGVNIIIV
jgi:DNA-binding XRE family transcriptional regulator